MLPFESGPAEWRRPGYVLTTARDRIDPASVLTAMRTEAYWVQDLPLWRFRRAIAGSLAFIVLADGGDIAGFGRVISDGATFAYIRDVFVVGAHRQRGLGRWIAACMVAHPDLAPVTNWTLATFDAHPLYAPLGFEVAPPGKFMQRWVAPDVANASALADGEDA